MISNLKEMPLPNNDAKVTNIPFCYNQMETSGGSRISQRGVRQPQGGANLLFHQFFPKTAWKRTNFGSEVEARVPCTPLDPPLETRKSSSKCRGH